MALVLDANPEILDLAFADLTSGRRSDTGREGMTAEQVLRCAIVKQSGNSPIMTWSFCWPIPTPYDLLPSCGRISFSSTSTLQSNIKSLREATWMAINQFIISYADEEKLEKGRKLRMDSTVVETDMYAPSDSTLLWDGVRVITRWLFDGKEFPPACLSLFRSSPRDEEAVIKASDHQESEDPGIGVPGHAGVCVSSLHLW